MTLPPSFSRVPLAHRALHDIADGRPENSRAAVRAAIAAGYGIEIDVQLSADDVAIVFHDYALDRLAKATGPVRLRGASELAGIPLIGNDEGIPNLSEILDLIAGQVPVVIEVKDQDGAMGKNVGPLERATAQALVGYTGDVAVMSFNPHSVALMRDLMPSVPRGLTTSGYLYDEWPLPKPICDRLRDIPDYDDVGACFISHDIDDLDRQRVKALKQDGAVICCWTVRSAGEEAEARKIADTITFEGYAAQHRP
ncbi:phosphodiesterase [Sulfitobacter sp. SK012]|uniref:glycerophosphodiester phosphodiesterase family protein n=1 Tax=Sulfitobacter sp. SK012 TaxID=1389005 RepID=UPI000E0C6EAD|nr:glycerophosphodiester phosphodiesterase family protein [Sulfitobacter sp. SK012]AXI48308.1 phosphodiesterase [Sulfitobacter sp. SK012]